MKNIYIWLWSMLIMPITIQAQTAAISGKIFTGEKPLELISVSLKGTPHGTLTDSTGHFTLKKSGIGFVQAGNHSDWLPERGNSLDSGRGRSETVGYGTE